MSQETLGFDEGVKDFFICMDRKLSACKELDEYYSVFLESFKDSQVYYLEYNEFSGQFVLVAQNSLCPKNSLWLNTKVSQLKIDERNHLKSFKKEIKKICLGLQEINDLPYVEAAVHTVCQKVTGLFIGFSAKQEVFNLPTAVKLLSYYVSQIIAPGKAVKNKKSFIGSIENEISRSKKTKTRFGMVSFFINTEKMQSLFFMKSLKKLILQKVNFSEDYLIRDNGNIIILKNYVDKEELAVWSYKTREAIKELYLKVEQSEEIKVAVGLSLYPEHGKNAKELILLSNKACEESLKTPQQKICLAQRGVEFKADYEPRL